MARDMEEAEKSLKELEKEITCSICKEHYTQPKALPCLHYYCKHCILKIAIRRGKDKSFSCPECRKEAILPEGNEDNLQTAFFVNRFKALYDKQKRTFSKGEFKHLAAVDKRKELMQCLRLMREAVTNLSHAVLEIENTERELKAQGEFFTNEIEASFKEFHTIIDTRKHQLLDEARRRVSQKMEKLQGQKRNMSISAAEVQSIVNYTEHCVNSSDDEVMCMYAEFGSTMKQEIEKYEKPWRKLMPVEEVDLGVEVRCAESLEQLLQTQTVITQLPVSFCINTISTKAEVDKLSEVILCTTKLCNNQPAKCAVLLDCHLKYMFSESLFISNIEEIGADRNRIEFIPNRRGLHELMISVDGHQVAGSPFPVFVSYPPTKHGEIFVKLCGDLMKPTGITVNSVGEIIVTEYDEDVVVLDMEGKRLRSINRSQYEFRYLQGVSVDSEDNIYFVDEGTNRIFKSNKNCSEVQVHKVEQVTGPGHLDVAVVGDEIMVTEVGNEGRIVVYNRELKYVRQIVGAYKNTLCCISPDSYQNVYVSDCGNSSIKVFSNNGEFLRSFCCDENDVKRLVSPWSVCVAGQYVYVADYGVCKIVVFTTEGDYVTSFGGRYYDGICVCHLGFVYASSYNKIDMY